MDGFRAYKTAEGRYAATQDTAGKGASQVVVPYKKADLLGFINGVYDEAYADGKDGVTLLSEVMKADETTTGVPHPQGPAIETVRTSPTPWTSQSVMEWVLDEASPADIENLFARLGTRFREAVK